jgi:hypothetical protein
MLNHHVAGDQIEAGVGKWERVQRCADTPGDIDVLAQVGEIKIDANDDPGKIEQFDFELRKVLTQKMPATTRVHPADRMSQILPDRFTPDFLVSPEMRQDSAL